MQETIIGDRKNPYHYESFPDDRMARDIKYKQLKQQGYKKIQVGEYKDANGRTIYFLSWE